MFLLQDTNNNFTKRKSYIYYSIWTNWNEAGEWKHFREVSCNLTSKKLHPDGLTEDVLQ